MKRVIDKAKPVARQGRKAKGLYSSKLIKIAELPKDKTFR